jgi:hypothetical protein
MGGGGRELFASPSADSSWLWFDSRLEVAVAVCCLQESRVVPECFAVDVVYLGGPGVWVDEQRVDGLLAELAYPLVPGEHVQA